jgi:sortase A
MRIPQIHVDTVVVEGVSPAALQAGAGHYPQTALPGERGNVGIAGHRRTYGRPFARLAELRPGDLVNLITPFESASYVLPSRVAGHGNPWTTDASDFHVLTEVGRLGTGRWLTLTTTGENETDRLVAQLKLRRSEPVTQPLDC